MVDETIILQSLVKIVEENPITGIETGDGVLVVSLLSGDMVEVDLNLPDHSDEFERIFKSNKILEASLNNLFTTVDTILNQPEKDDIDVEAVVFAVLETMGFRQKLRDEVSAQVRDVLPSVGESIITPIIDTLVDSINEQIEGIESKQKTLESGLKRKATPAQINKVVNEQVKLLNEKIESLEYLSPDEVADLIRDNQIELPVFVVDFKVENGRLWAIYSDGSREDLGHFQHVKQDMKEGPRGPKGKSAYQLAVENGFQGTLEQWLDSLEGGGSAGSSETYIDDTRTTTKTLVYNGVTTGQNGYFSFQTAVFNYVTNIEYYEGQEFIIGGPDPVENRIVTVHIEEISTNGRVMGYAFMHRNSMARPGEINKTIVPVPENTPIRVKIIGS